MTIRPAIRSGWFFVPYEAIGPTPVRQALKERLTFLPRSYGEDDDPASRLVLMYKDWPEREMLGVPRAYGEHHYGHLPIEDHTSLGSSFRAPKRPDPNHPRVKDPVAQAKFMADLKEAFTQHDTFIAEAPTGSGKTVCALETAAHLGRRFLVLTHLNRLSRQWASEIHDKLGIPYERIGWVQSDTCTWRDKDAVVGILHSANMRDYGRDFRNAFGLVIYDEVHKVGSRFFAPAVSQFSAKYRLGLSATVQRSDGGEHVFHNHLGPTRVTSTAEALEMKVYPLRYTTRGALWGNNMTLRQKCLSLDEERNRWLVDKIKKLHAAGRQILAVSFSVDHLQHIMDLCHEAGIPRKDMGQFTGKRHGGQYCPIKYVRDEKTRAVKGILRQFDKDTGEPKITSIKTDIKTEELDDVKANSQIIFATYGMMTEGIDIARLDAGIDLTPRGKATQITGRIRRPVPGKKQPVWLTPVDTRCSQSMRLFSKRCGDYRRTKAEIVNG